MGRLVDITKFHFTDDLEASMQYTFNLVGVSPILSFFYQQQQQQEQQTSGIEYLGHRQCTLDMFLESVEMVASKQGWQCDRVVDLSLIHI